MSILVVDDSYTNRVMLKAMLEEAGYNLVLMASDAFEAFEKLGLAEEPSTTPPVDLILMDIIMPEMSGIEACRHIKTREKVKNIPIIMVTGRTGVEVLEQAFAAGAHDYLIKPVNKIELLARARAALRLKQEIDKRVKREEELIEVTKLLEKANKKLQHLSAVDGLTGIANRRQFDQVLVKEWKRSVREGCFLSLIIMDIDFFKPYNDTLGHAAGDVSLTQVAKALESNLQRGGDLVARYGGEEFGVVLPNTDLTGALHVAERLRKTVEELKIPHPRSSISPFITVSLGVCTMDPDVLFSSQMLIDRADKALYKAKKNGRNRVEYATASEALDKH